VGRKDSFLLSENEGVTGTFDLGKEDGTDPGGHHRKQFLGGMS